MNSVFQITDCCRTCLRVESALTPLNTLDTDNIKLCDKLVACISDIAWTKSGYSNLLCSNCTEKLRIAYDFRLLCIHSENASQQYFSQEKITSYTNLDDYQLTNTIQIQNIQNNIIEPPTKVNAHQNNEYLNLKQFLDEEELSKSSKCIENSRSTSPDSVATTGFARYEKITKKAIVPTRSVKTQTQPLPQYPSLTPAAARLEAQQSKTTIIIEDPYKFSCAVCGKKYAKNANLKIHMRTHTVHMKKHTGEKFICKVCSQEFTHSSQLTVHMREHTGRQPYRCTICDKICNYASELQTHMMKHT
ncbi:zf-AD domain containing protein, partial [Asbolus verrucosus]